MSRRAVALGVGAIAALAILATVWWATSGRRPASSPLDGQPEAQDPLETRAVELYFPSTSGWLGAESRELPAATSAEQRATQIAAAVLAGPAETDHVAPLGEGVELASLYLSGDGVVYLDLAAGEMAMPPVSGSRGELLVVYSFVNSILANVPEARGVALLWNGSQRPTFAGHVDTTRPLPQESKWLAQR